MSEEYEVPAHHEQHIEHEAHHGSSLSQQVAIFTAILATLGAIISYQGGHTQNEALYYKNEGVYYRSLASDQWAYYQAKGLKQEIDRAELSRATDPKRIQELQDNLKRNDDERKESMQKAKDFDAANHHAEHALHPHEKLALAVTLIQIAISAASITALTRKRWLLGLAGVAAVGGVGTWAMAFLVS